MLVNLVRKPFKYEIKPGSGPGSSGVLFVEGERFDIRRLYNFPGIQVRTASMFDIAYALGVNDVTFSIMPTGASSSLAEQKGAIMAMGIAAQLYANGLMAERSSDRAPCSRAWNATSSCSRISTRKLVKRTAAPCRCCKT